MNVLSDIFYLIDEPRNLIWALAILHMYMMAQTKRKTSSHAGYVSLKFGP